MDANTSLRTVPPAEVPTFLQIVVNEPLSQGEPSSVWMPQDDGLWGIETSNFLAHHSAKKGSDNFCTTKMATNPTSSISLQQTADRHREIIDGSNKQTKHPFQRDALHEM